MGAAGLVAAPSVAVSPARLVPSVLDAETPLDALQTLLALAAEVEHALMVQYLYAAASLKSGTTSETADARTKIVQIAMQEMAHFLTLQNLLIAVGGVAHLHVGRDGLRAINTDNPLPFSLEKLSRQSAARYVLAERPAEIPDPALRKKVADLEAVAGEDGSDLPKRVGALYEQITLLVEGLASSDFRHPDEILAHAGGPSAWNASSGPDMRIHVVTDEASALFAIRSVSAQGEGFGGDQASHFHEFLDVFDLVDGGRVEVSDLATTPFVGGAPPVGAPSPTRLGHNYNRLWARMLNVRYSLILLEIGHALATPVADPVRPTLIGFAFDDMTPHLGSLMAYMASPEASDREGGRRCGPTLELLHEDLPPTDLERWRRYGDLLALEGDLAAALRSRPELADDVDGELLLEDLDVSRAARTDVVSGRS